MRGGSQTIDRAPPPVLDTGDGGGGGWAWLLTAGGIIEAQLVRGLLETAGVVPIHLDSYDPSPSSWMFLSGNVNAPVRVFVLASQLDLARLVLLEGGFGVGETDAGPRQEPLVRSSWWRRLWIILGIVIVLGLAWRLFLVGCDIRTVC